MRVAGARRFVLAPVLGRRCRAASRRCASTQRWMRPTCPSRSATVHSGHDGDRARRRPPSRAASASASPSRRIAATYSRVLHQADATATRSSSSGPLLSALLTSVDDRPHLELVGRAPGRAAAAARRRRGTRGSSHAVPLGLRAARPACGRGSAASSSFGLGRDDRERADARRVVADLRVVPDLPQPRERERLTVAAADEPRLLLLRALELLPLVEAVGRDDRAGASRTPACTRPSSRPTRRGR